MQVTQAGFYNQDSFYYNSKESKEDEKSVDKSESNPNELSQEEQAEVDKLEAIDTHVRAHEAAHQAVGGALAGAASFTYQRGPDNKMYAIGGEVPIATREAQTPDETIQIAQQVIAAALAPSDPSPQDYSVASSATMMIKAQQQKAKESQDEANGLEAYKDEKEQKNNLDITI
ncbi:MAG: putative metalloprotease CJM1_0395 family protein [Sulfurimonas sp.]